MIALSGARYKQNESKLRGDVIKLGDLARSHRNKSIIIAFHAAIAEWRRFINNPTATLIDAEVIARDEAEAAEWARRGEVWKASAVSDNPIMHPSTDYAKYADAREWWERFYK